jgi:hypothetical protein
MRLADSAFAKGAAVAAVVAFALYVIGTWDQDAAAPAVALQVPTGLEGVALGERLAALASTHGPFDKEPPRPGVTRKHADEEDYVQRNGTLRLGVRKGFVSSVAYSCKEGRDRTTLNNIACRAGPDRIKAVFGDRVRILCAKARADDPNRDLAASVRAYDVVEYATRYVVIKDAVAGFMVFQPGELETLVGLNWERCASARTPAR